MGEQVNSNFVRKVVGKLELVLPFATLIASAVVLVFTVYKAFYSNDSSFQARLDQANQDIKVQLSLKVTENLSKEVKELAERIDGALLKDPQALRHVEGALLQESISKLSIRLEVLEKAILESPEKSLAIPMMRKDQDLLSKSFEISRAALKQEIDRLYEQQKWMLSGIGAVLLAVIAWSLNIISKAYLKTSE
ncbi:hypothetical protein ACK9U2_001214 [Pseudomonas putida]